ncbi:MAG TPA: queuosine salvage family protein [Thermoanaerobaculia bacterium]|nr:queuosine salvage family protein [Thermoanaerobaculia bacterium]
MSEERLEQLPERVRAACAWVAGRARAVVLDEAALREYAATLPADVEPLEPDPSTQLAEGDRETRAAFVVCLGAINFGSGWWPTIRKRPGHSGYRTIAAGVVERFRAAGAWPAAELAQIGPAEIAAVTGQDADHPLMADFAAALRDVGEHVRDEHGGSFSSLAEAADRSAPALAGLLAEWRAFADSSSYEGRQVPFFKRAQLVAADLDRFVAPLAGVDRLTAFADNLVPHVLRVDGVLRLDAELAARLDDGELLEHGSAEEVELRACAVHAVELLASARGLAPAEVDLALWTRGGEPRYKAIPRPRSRNTAY